MVVTKVLTIIPYKSSGELACDGLWYTLQSNSFSWAFSSVAEINRERAGNDKLPPAGHSPRAHSTGQSAHSTHHVTPNRTVNHNRARASLKDTVSLWKGTEKDLWPLLSYQVVDGQVLLRCWVSILYFTGFPVYGILSGQPKETKGKLAVGVGAAGKKILKLCCWPWDRWQAEVGRIWTRKYPHCSKP